MNGAAFLIRNALKKKNMTQKQLAEMLGLKYQTIMTKLYRDNMPFADAEKILDVLGYELTAVDKETGERLL